ncbi:DUF3168 domain-containing protein [Marinobacterium sp. BA1]|uniref:tail completion protein gp17 n=1 Tax=Marinobacterium sp. BA1 TaxID=3138931 RepID=UPI0032E598D9
MNEQQLHIALSTSPDIIQLVNSDDIYNGYLPESAKLPAVTFYYVSSDPDNTLHDGYTGHALSRYSINVWSKSYPQIQELRAAVKAAMAGHVLQSDIPLHEPDNQLYRFVLDYTLYD